MVEKKRKMLEKRLEEFQERISHLPIFAHMTSRHFHWQFNTILVITDSSELGRRTFLLAVQFSRTWGMPLLVGVLQEDLDLPSYIKAFQEDIKAVVEFHRKDVATNDESPHGDHPSWFLEIFEKEKLDLPIHVHDMTSLGQGILEVIDEFYAELVVIPAESVEKSTTSERESIYDLVSELLASKKCSVFIVQQPWKITKDEVVESRDVESLEEIDSDQQKKMLEEKNAEN